MIDYRRPLPNEAEAMAALHVQCWHEAYGDFLPAELLASFSVQARLPMWQSVIPHAGRFVLGAYDNGVAVGFVISGPAEERHIAQQDGHLWAIYISAQYHRQGIGRVLIGLAAADWLAHGGHTMTVGVLADNLPARRFYESLGARLVKAGTYHWDGHPLADCIYVFENLSALTP